MYAMNNDVKYINYPTSMAMNDHLKISGIVR